MKDPLVPLRVARVWHEILRPSAGVECGADVYVGWRTPRRYGSQDSQAARVEQLREARRAS